MLTSGLGVSAPQHGQSPLECVAVGSLVSGLAYHQQSPYPTHNSGHPPSNWSVPTCILEMRKEKSRDAARSRRGKENFEFYELAKLLPLPAAITSQLDKASIIRLTISYLRLRDFSHNSQLPWTSSPTAGTLEKHILKSSPLRPSRSVATEMFEQHQGTHILQSLDGFAFVLGADGRFLYISETVSIYLGLSQVEMTGSTIFDYVHQQDHSEVSEQLGLSPSCHTSSSSPSSAANSDDGSCDRPVATMHAGGSNSSFQGLDRSFCIRMKSTLTRRGCHFKSSGYRVVLVLCHLRPQNIYVSNSKQTQPILGLVALAVALPPPSVNEVRLGCDMFVTRVNLDFRISHCEPRVNQLLDYSSEDLTGRNIYTLCHAQDVYKLRQLHMDIMHKGQSMSGYYRIMNKSGGYTWMQTCATVICASKQSSQEEQSIICVNYVISSSEYESIIMDASQVPGYREPSPIKKSIPDDLSSTTPSPTPKINSIDSSLIPMPTSVIPIPLSGAINKLDPDVQCDTASSPLTYQVLDDNKVCSNGTSSTGKRKYNTKTRKRAAQCETPDIKDKKETTELSRPWKNDDNNVKDLEDAMKKHLPNEAKIPHQPPAIQWIDAMAGVPAPPPPSAATQSSATSSLLRQLYVNRETVIRNSSNSTANARSSVAYYGDVAPTEGYPHTHYHSPVSDFMTHLTQPYPSNGYDTYGAPGRDTGLGMMPTALPSMQRHPYDLPLRPQVLVHPSLDYAPAFQTEPQLYHHLSGT